MSDLPIEMTVNGRPVKRRAAAHLRLLDFLRDDLNLTGTKEGCGAGECGTCSVFVDGKLVKSCLMPLAKAQGADDRDRRRSCRQEAISSPNFSAPSTRPAPANAATASPAW